MNIKRLEIQNFMTIEHGVLDFDGSGVRLIEGVNHDSPTSISNGSGKSTVPEALQWALFGTTRRGLKGDEVILRKAGNNFVVKLYFDNYMIVRSRKCDTNGTGLRLYQMGYDSDGGLSWLDISKGTMKDTQELIEHTIKMSELTFTKVAYFGQGDVKGFASLTDKELKAIFEQALGLTFFSEYLAGVKAERVQLEADLSNTRQSLNNNVRSRDFAQEKIKLLERVIEDHNKKANETIDNAAGDIKAAMEERLTVSDVTEEEIAKAEEEIHTLREQEASLVKFESLKGQLSVKIMEVNKDLAFNRAGLAALEKEMRQADADLIHLDSLVGTECKECGKTYEETDLDAARAATILRSNLKTIEVKDKKSEVRAIEAELTKLEALGSQLDIKIGEFTGVRERIAALEHHIKSVTESARTRIESLNRRIGQLRDRIASVKTEDEDAKKDLEVARRDVDLAQSVIDQGVQDIARLEEEIDTAKTLEEILSSDLKSHVFDSITPELNRLVDQNIKALDDIDIEISTVKRLKSGGFREKFAICVDNRHGADVFCGNSGGEQQKVNLSIALAMNRLIRAMAESPINCIFLDEAFENLDEGSSDAVAELIKSIDTPNVFLITHRPGIKELIPDAIVVEKRGGASIIH